MKKLNRTLSFLLALVIVFTMVPAAGLAVVDQQVPTAKDPAYVTSPVGNRNYAQVVARNHPQKADGSIGSLSASISAGNSSSAAYGNGWGTNVNLAGDPDNGVVSSPATYPGATVVGSVENTHFMSNYITADGREIVYIDYYAVPGYYEQSMLAYTGEQTFVVVPGLGTPEDFAQVDVTGKIALVHRGEISFVEKQTNAANAGAIACLVYDNVEGTLISMQPANLIPSAFITMADGLYLVELAGEDGEGTLTVMPADDMIAADSPLAGQMSDFSSWGVTPDLQLVPDVSAPCGNIYSCYMDGEYGAVNLSLPFMGFYGDWSDARIFDDGGWVFDDQAIPERYLNILWTVFGSNGFLLGENPYIDEPYDPAHNVISPNGDGYQDAVNDVYLGLMRNARDLAISWQIDGETVASAIASYVRKSYYLVNYGICFPFIYSDYFGDQYYTFMDENGDPLPDGTVVDMVFEGYLDDGDDEVDDTIDYISMVVDNTAPVLHLDTLELVYDEETDSRYISFQVSDNYDIAAVMPLTNTGAPIEYIAVDDEAGEKVTIELDVSGFDSSFYIAVCDYGCNESYYEINFEGEFDVDFDKFYAYRRLAAVPGNDGYIYIIQDYNGWHSFEDPSTLLMHTSQFGQGEAAVESAEYIDGYIFGVDVEGTVFVMKAGDWTRIPLTTMPTGYDANYEEVPYPTLDMTFDYTTNTLYILTDELTLGAGGHLMTLDYMTGDIIDLGTVTTVEGSQPLTLACDNSGVLYTVDYVSGDLYTVHPEDAVTTEPENWWEEAVTTIPTEFVGSTGYVPMYTQSMTVDHETDTLYWLAFSSVYNADSSILYQVDKTTGELTAVGNVEYNSEMTALYKPYDSGEDIIPDAELEYVTLNKAMITLGVNAMEQLIAYPNPFNADLGELTWTSDDESVALVEDGLVLAVGEGAAVITVSTADGLTAECTVNVVDLSTQLVQYDMMNTYMWQTYNAGDPADLITLEDATAPFNGVTAAAYFNGTIYAYGQDSYAMGTYKNYFLTIDAETYEITAGAKIHYTLRDMAMDYTTDNLYAIAEGGDCTGAVALVDRETGEVTVLAETGVTFAAMTIDANGQMYGIGEDDNLYAIDKATGAVTLVGSTGVNAGALFQSMHYDLNTGNTYWAQVADDTTSSLRIVDLTTGSSTSLGTICSTGAEITAMYTIPENEPTEPDEDTFTVTGIKLPETSTVVKGNTLQLNATVLTSVELQPAGALANTVNGVTVTWASDNQSVATVDENGLVTAIAAGEANITASAEGFTATCKVVVTESERLLYAYDETNAQWISFSSSEPGTVTTVRADAEGEAKLVAATYTGEVIYAYDADGKFWSVDPETFERTALGDGINGKVYEMVTTDWWGDTYTVECALSVTDLSWDNGTLYAAAGAIDPDWGDTLTTLLCTVDTATGDITTIFESNQIKPTNLLVDNGVAFFVDGFMSGLLTTVDLTADEFSFTQAALVQGYWGYAEASVGLFKDQLTGTVYALRDFTQSDGYYNSDYTEYYPWDGLSGNATLCTLNLADADIVELGTVGTGLQLVGLFIK